jgi:outer membrane protein TolC
MPKISWSPIRPAFLKIAPSPWNRLVILTLIGSALTCGSQGAEATQAESPLRLNELRRMVLDQNDQIQMRLQDAEVSERLHRAEKGIFEPQLVGGAEYFDTSRPNNRQQSAQLGFFARPFYLERNTLYNAGIEFLLGTGAKLRTGYMLRDLNNNIGAAETTPGELMGQQYESFAGLNLSQPLLKNAGWGATTAKIRLSAISSKIAFHEYRRQILLVLASAEAAYWDLHLAQEQVRIGTDSLATAQKILKDNQARLEVGKSSELEVMQAQAGLAARKAKLEQAQQTAFDYASRISSLYSRSIGGQNSLPRAVDVPELVDDPTSKVESYTQAFRKNPDYLIRAEQVKQENLRVAYLKNQRLPQLDLKASYGLNGLSSNVVQSMDDWATREYPAWSLGFEFRVPLGGGIKERNELEAGKLGKIRALSALKEAEVQVFNLVDTALRKIQLHRNSLTNARSVIGFHEKLLAAQLDRLAVGSVDSRMVLETEEKLSEARAAAVDSMVMERKARLELEAVRGTLLLARDAEVDLFELRKRTEEFLRKNRDKKVEEAPSIPVTNSPNAP